MIADICRIPTNGEALLFLYADKVVLNAAACALVGLADGNGRIRFVRNLDARSEREKTRIYVGAGEDGYRCRRYRRSVQINSRHLCALLASRLDGFGTYRVCPESFVDDVGGDRFYEVFFRRYKTGRGKGKDGTIKPKPSHIFVS